jgi:hypothetical protein
MAEHSLVRGRDDAALAERRQVMRRSVRGLPDEMVDALARGLERHADRLAAGRLFATAAGGGCAVGVLLRELQPEAYRQGRLHFLLRHAWRRRAASYGGELGRNPRLRHLEWSFDEAVNRTRELEPGCSTHEAARAVGDWLLAEARAEIAWRALAAAAVGGGTLAEPGESPSRASVSRSGRAGGAG